MPSTATPFGAQPRYHPSGRAVAQAFPNPWASGYASAIYQGSPVILADNGLLTVGTTAADVLGIFDGVEYTDGNGRRQFSKYWPASQAATEIVAYVWTDPGIVYEMQSSATLAITAIGDQADFVNPGSGSTTTGLSSAAFGTLVGTSAQGQLRVIGLSNAPGNAWGDPYVNVLVQIARHQYVGNKVAI